MMGRMNSSDQLEQTIASSEEAHVNEATEERPRAMVRGTARRSAKSRKNAPKRAKRKHGNPLTRRFTRFVTVSWSGGREPAELIWAEASVDGNWIVLETLDRVHTRKEIQERILALNAGLVLLNFNFSYPATFLEFLRTTEGIADWRGMVHKVREDLKKNVDDGIRLWVERLGRYREWQLDPTAPRGKLQRNRRFDDWGWSSGHKGLAPHEQRSMAERFRHTDLPLRRLAGDDVMSTMQIGYNRLTSRYEFNGNIRGRDALLGMALLDQLLEAGGKRLGVWPMMEPKQVTIAETLPWLFRDGEIPKPEDLETIFDNYEDAGWEIPPTIRRIARTNALAREAIFTLIGMVRTEQRINGKHRHSPIRQYHPAIYRDPRVKDEGWIYGLSFRPMEEKQSGYPKSNAEDVVPEETMQGNEEETPAPGPKELLEQE